MKKLKIVKKYRDSTGRTRVALDSALAKLFQLSVTGFLHADPSASISQAGARDLTATQTYPASFSLTALWPKLK